MPALVLALAALAADPAAKPAAGPLDGTWLFDDFRRSAKDDEPYLVMVWGSPVVVAGDTFAVKNCLGGEADLRGRFAFDPAHPSHVDLIPAEFDLTPLGFPAKIPAGVRKGVFARAGGTVRVALAADPTGDRPAGLDDKASKVMRLTLVRAPAGVTEPPRTVRVAVTGPDGQPAAGVVLETQGMFWPGGPTAKGEPLKTAADGTAGLDYDALRGGVIFARDDAGMRFAFAAVSPASLAGGAVGIRLTPGREVVVPVTCPDLPTDELKGVLCYVHATGRRAAIVALDPARELRFFAPPGEYKLNVYANAIVGRRVPLTVPAGDGRFTAPAVVVRASAGALLVGKPAPEFTGVAASVGGSVKLADYRGQFVVIDFWGYWCGPCIAAMPTWIAVHDKFQGKGVAVIGVHYDADGEVTTAAAYHAKLASIKEKLWAGRDLPFPVALVPSKDGDRYTAGPSAQYGVTGWPQTFLIDPAGNVVGEFGYDNANAAIADLASRVAAWKAKK